MFTLLKVFFRNYGQVSFIAPSVMPVTYFGIKGDLNYNLYMRVSSSICVFINVKKIYFFVFSIFDSEL